MSFSALTKLGHAAALASLAALGVAGGSAIASAQNTDEITVTVTKVQALDKIDVFSKADLFAKITIGGESCTTNVIKQQDWAKPGWTCSKRVRKGASDVKIELFDKDVTKNDPIDINRVDKKRDLDFSVNTANCRISGFSDGYSCGDRIVRAGNERKKAEITFRVDVKR